MNEASARWRRILVVEDYADASKSLARLLRDACECVPENLQMDGYYGTEYEGFSFRGYEQLAEPLNGLESQ